MVTKVIFNTDKHLKAAAMKKARSQGLTLSAVLNMATKAYVDNRIEISVFDRDLAKALEDVRKGRVTDAETVHRRLGL